MEGFKYNETDEQRGIIPRAMEEIFVNIQSEQRLQTKFMIRVSYLQIYNESISDLLKSDRVSLQIREDKRKGVFVEGLSEWAVRTPAEIYNLL
jgi:kinesin family protein 3/17